LSEGLAGGHQRFRTDKIDLRARATDMGTSSSGGCDPRACSLTDDLAFEFGHSGDDVKGKSSSGSAGIYPIHDRDEVDGPGTKVLERRNEVTNGPSKSVEAPHEHDPDLAPVDVAHEPVEFRASVLASAEPLVDVLADDFPAALSTNAA
jgi:hypothetical protein